MKWESTVKSSLSLMTGGGGSGGGGGGLHIPALIAIVIEYSLICMCEWMCVTGDTSDQSVKPVAVCVSLGLYFFVCVSISVVRSNFNR